MKKTFILIAFTFLCVMSISIWAKADPLTKEQEKHPIDIQQEKCMEKDYSTAGMNRCAYEATDAWLKEVSKYTDLIKKELSTKQLEIFTNTQQNWQKYYDTEKKLIAETVCTKEGTIHTNIAAGMVQNLAKQRALYLKSYLYELKDE